MIAMMVADEVADHAGIVVGPFDTVSAALASLDSSPIDAAIIDANLLDRTVTPVAHRLLDLAIPFVIYSGTGLPDDLAASAPHSPLEMKPGRPVDRLIDMLRDAAESQAG